VAKERLSRLQKWILVTAYKKMSGVVPDGVIFEKSRNDYKDERMKKIAEECEERRKQQLFRYEILYNRFSLPLKEKGLIRGYIGEERVSLILDFTAPDYNKAYVSVIRSEKNLEKKRLITIDKEGKRVFVMLTDEGIARVEEILNVNK